jgi:hypothetical protein
MKLIEPVTDEQGRPRSFYTYRIPFGRLCRCIASLPGVEFTQRPRFFWWGEDVNAEFRYKGRDFKIETIWADTHVCPKDDVSAYPEIEEIEEHIERNGRSILNKWVRRVLGNNE